jgi:purine-nucleoside phosphorylase
LYEGHSAAAVVYGVRLLAQLGVRSVLLTNAAGGFGADFTTGDLMLLTDHLNLTGHNPLAGGLSGSRSRFCDMTSAYDSGLRALAAQAAAELGITLRQGIYAGVLGPSYETPAEIRMLQALGADAVGMSTVLETIALRQLEVRVGAMSLITNLAAGLSPTPLSHEDVKATAAVSQTRFSALLHRWCELVLRQEHEEPSDASGT